MCAQLHLEKLLEIAYQIAKDNFHDKQFTFSMVWSKTWKAATEFKKEAVEDWIGIFYTGLQLDTRFVKYHNNTMRLKEYISYAEYKKLDKSTQTDDILLEEDFEKTPKKTKEKNSDPITDDESINDLLDAEI